MYVSKVSPTLILPFTQEEQIVLLGKEIRPDGHGKQCDDPDVAAYVLLPQSVQAVLFTEPLLGLILPAAQILQPMALVTAVAEEYVPIEQF